MTASLSELGFRSEFAEALAETPDAQAARVIRLHRNHLIALAASGELEATIPGRLHHQGRAPVVGDWVAILGEDSDYTVDRVLPRRTSITRLAAGRAADIQVVAANIDIAFVVTGVDGDFNVRRLERYATQIAAGGATPVIVLSKVDLAESSQDFVTRVKEVLPQIDVECTSTHGPPGVSSLERYFTTGATAVFIGSSGVGKSTLVNAFLEREALATGPVRAKDDRGRHTTSHRELFMRPGGGLIMDTPGLRELKVMASEDDLATTFADIAELAQNCRFRDCSHGKEPGCAVQEALRSGTLDRARFAAFQALREEIAENERRASARAKRAEGRRQGINRRIANKRRKERGTD